jgi:ribosomal protein S18 acetylase RimI-like enzyme
MISIRKAVLADAEIVSQCLLLAMEDIVYKFIGAQDPAKARQFMSDMVSAENNQYSYQNCWVAEENSEVVAAMNLYDGARLSELRQPVIEYLRTRFNMEFDHEDETGEGEYYIDSLAVHPVQQVRGIGTKLLEFVINEYVNKHGETLGLLVDEGNTDAKRFYLKLGFKRAGARLIFGKRMVHMQMNGAL